MDLHEAMRLILLDCEGRMSDLGTIVEENRRRKLYRCPDETSLTKQQLIAMAKRYPTWFALRAGLIQLTEGKQ